MDCSRYYSIIPLLIFRRSIAQIKSKDSNTSFIQSPLCQQHNDLSKDMLVSQECTRVSSAPLGVHSISTLTAPFPRNVCNYDQVQPGKVVTVVSSTRTPRQGTTDFDEIKARWFSTICLNSIVLWQLWVLVAMDKHQPAGVCELLVATDRHQPPGVCELRILH